MGLVKEKMHRSLGQNRVLEIEEYIQCELTFDKGEKAIQCRKEVFSTNGTGTI